MELADIEGGDVLVGNADGSENLESTSEQQIVPNIETNDKSESVATAPSEATQ